MKKLALSDDILLKIEKPARYLGNEVNHVVKDPEGKIRFAMCFPDVYEIGMSHLGIQILYDLLNAREDVYCLRWNHRIRLKILIFWELQSSTKCAIPIFCRFWICPAFRCWRLTVARMIRL